METESPNKTQLPFYIGVTVLLLMIAIELLIILSLNDNFFTYTLDDPYIHLALAENIRLGHYGINAGEFSAPSSSILWPIILAPLSSFEYSPFLFNTASSLAIVFILAKILETSFDVGSRTLDKLFKSAIVVLLVLATNIVGLLFTGMEHSLQVLFVLLVAYGLILEIERNEIRWWLLAAIIIAPLVRYECLAISVAAIVFMAIRGHIKQAVFSIAAILLLTGGFTVFLASVGLGPLPSSVTAKSSLVQSGVALDSVIANLEGTLSNRQGVILIFGALILFLYCLFGRDRSRRQIALVAVFACIAHFLAGTYGLYNRYEIYIWSFTIIIAMYVFAPSVNKFLATRYKRSAVMFAVAIATGFTVIAARPYVYDLANLPLAANNIYQQHYQMHRFVVEFYNKPVAVNDLGYVSYQNSNYILDLWGLGSDKALQHRLNDSNSAWMKEIADESDIGLAMIYEGWFSDIPKEWIKVGELKLGNALVTPASSRVAFYATSEKAKPEIENKLRLFISTLPAGVKFIYTSSNS